MTNDEESQKEEHKVCTWPNCTCAADAMCPGAVTNAFDELTTIVRRMRSDIDALQSRSKRREGLL